MRTRERNRDTSLLFGTYGTFECNVSHNRISDVNNGLRGPRPESPCQAYSATYAPVPVIMTNGAGMGCINAPARSYSFYVQEFLAREVIFSHYDRCTSKMQRLIDKQVGSFSSLNFFYELRELPDLFRKLATPEDFRYIDWQFAISPTLSDLRSALTAYNAAASSLNEKMKRFRNIECNATYVDTIFRDGQLSYFSGNPHRQADTVRVKTVMHGTVEMDVPWLSGVNPQLFMLLDSLAIDPSASNAWQAMPWSWFIDWFVPIGDWLESLPTSMKPLTRFRGTISHKVSAFSDIWSVNSGPGFSFAGGQEAGRLQAKSYERTPFNAPRSELIRWRLDSLSNPSQIALLRDIMFPADIKRGKSILR